MIVGDLWERATFMCGMERLLLYVAQEPDFVARLLGGITDYILGTMDILLARFDVDAIFRKIKRREHLKKRFSIVIIAEGAEPESTGGQVVDGIYFLSHLQQSISQM